MNAHMRNAMRIQEHLFGLFVTCIILPLCLLAVVLYLPFLCAHYYFHREVAVEGDVRQVRREE